MLFLSLTTDMTYIHMKLTTHILHLCFVWITHKKTTLKSFTLVWGGLPSVNMLYLTLRVKDEQNMEKEIMFFIFITDNPMNCSIVCYTR